MRGPDRLATVPNVLSLGRLLCVPLFVWLLFGAGDRFGAAVLLAVLGATDWVDGWFARRFDQVSTFGKVVDPVADRVLLATAAVCIVVAHAVPFTLFAVVIIREVLVSAAVVGLAAAGAPRIDVLWVGKAGTLALMVAMPLFLVAGSGASWHGEANVAAWVFAIPGVVLAWVAAASYLPPARRALAQARVRSGG